MFEKLKDKKKDKEQELRNEIAMLERKFAEIGEAMIKESMAASLQRMRALKGQHKEIEDTLIRRRRSLIKHLQKMELK